MIESPIGGDPFHSVGAGGGDRVGPKLVADPPGGQRSFEERIVAADRVSPGVGSEVEW